MIKQHKSATPKLHPHPMKKLSLILTVLTIISTCSFGQHTTDTISMKKVPGGYQFYQGENRLTISELIVTIKPNAQAYQQIKSAQANFTMGQVLGYAGGFIIGYQLGRALWSSEVNWRMAGLGAGLIVLAIPVSQGFNTKARQAIDTYNRRLPASAHRNKSEINLSATGNGIGLVLKF
jgi:hypothetical protein